MLPDFCKCRYRCQIFTVSEKVSYGYQESGPNQYYLLGILGFLGFLILSVRY